MILDTTTRSLEIYLGGPVTTNELPILVSYIEGQTVLPESIPFVVRSISSGASDVTILAAPEPKTRRIVKYLSIYNKDTVNAVVTLQLNDNGTDAEIIKVTLTTDDTLVYTLEGGFRVINSTGGVVMSVPTHTLASHSTRAHSELTGVATDDHHTLYTDAEAISAVEGEATLALTGRVTNSGRHQNGKGVNLTAADEMALGTDGNFFEVDGTTTINHLTNTNWQAGSVVTLQFNESVTVTHNAGTPTGTEASLLLAGAANLSATASDTLTLVYDGVTFREIGRAVI